MVAKLAEIKSADIGRSFKENKNRFLGRVWQLPCTSDNAKPSMKRIAGL
jgi:hypothetical protein